MLYSLTNFVQTYLKVTFNIMNIDNCLIIFLSQFCLKKKLKNQTSFLLIPLEELEIQLFLKIDYLFTAYLISVSDDFELEVELLLSS